MPLILPPPPALDDTPSSSGLQLEHLTPFGFFGPLQERIKLLDALTDGYNKDNVEQKVESL